MANVGDGSNWDVVSPSNGGPTSEGALEVRDVRKGTALRYNKEHETAANGTITSSALRGTGGGEHRAGSAKAFYVATAGVAGQTKRPDGITSLDSNDAGRLLVVSDTQQLSYWTGSAWAGLLCLAANLASNAVTLVKVIDGCFTADATGRAKFADGFVNTAKLATGSVTTAKIVDAAITLAKLDPGVPTGQFYQGNYVGNGTGNKNVSPIGFAPNYVQIVKGTGSTPVTYSFFKSESASAASAFPSGNSGTKIASALAFETDGFTITSADGGLNANAVTYYFTAIKDS